MQKIDMVEFLNAIGKISLQRPLSKRRPSCVIRCVGEKNFKNPHSGTLTRETAASVSAKAVYLRIMEQKK
jgi:hypothetical protein